MRLARGRAVVSVLLFSLIAGLLGAELAIRTFDLFASERELTRVPSEERGRPGAASPWALVHPYQGFSMRPGGNFEVAYLDYLERALPEGEQVRREEHSRNVFGFRSSIRDYREVAESDYAVGIFGGSMAEHVAVLGGEALATRLGLLVPGLAGRVRVLNFAAGAYKQPQPLLVLMQAVLLKIPLDAVVEIDGYNELVFGDRNAKQGHHPLFPSRFHTDALVQVASGDPSEELIVARAEIARSRRRAESWRRYADAPLLAASELARALCGVLVSRQLASAAETEAALQEAPASSSLVATLPDPCLDAGDCSELVVDLWERSSLAMSRLAEASGLAYLHVLQPNQYVLGSKPLSREERALLDPADPWARAARSGYPRLIERGRSLREQGVAFVDATGLFRGVTDSRYVDACCHVDARGNRELARTVAEELAELLAEKAPQH
jgi:hypothetical protein